MTWYKKNNAPPSRVSLRIRFHPQEAAERVAAEAGRGGLGRFGLRWKGTQS